MQLFQGLCSKEEEDWHLIEFKGTGFVQTHDGIRA